MESSRYGGHIYQNPDIAGSARVHLGDVINHDLSRDERIKRLILDSLAFPEMHARRDSVRETEEFAYDWLFDAHDVEGDDLFWCQEQCAQSRSLLVSWLIGPHEEPFWVSGKPGSGKSMFMKALQNHPHTIDMLRDWSQDAKLVVLDHYFWLAGSQLQSSWLGCLRVLLHALLSATSTESNVGLLQAVFAERWSLESQHRPWTTRVSEGILKTFCGTAPFRLAIFIDGLDECTPQDQHYQLVQKVHDISQWPNVKLCISSRPQSVFSGQFGSLPCIRLEDVTAGDMAQYVEESLTSAERLQSSIRYFRDHTSAAQDLIRRIVFMAEGVFLWTDLVVKRLSSELRKGRDLDALYRTLAEFPGDLEAYYHELVWKRIPNSEQDRKDTARMLSLAVRLQGRGVSFMVYHILNRGLTGEHVVPRWYTREEAMDLLQDMSTFLTESCGDTLTISLNDDDILSSTVEFTHRTMLDFLSSDTMTLFLAEHDESGFLDRVFLPNLEKLRPRCVLLVEGTTCDRAIQLLNEAVEMCKLDINKDRAITHVVACETLATEQLSKYCRCFFAVYQELRLAAGFLSFGFDKYAWQLLKTHPTVTAKREPAQLGILAAALMLLPKADLGEINVPLVKYLLDSGCDPNDTCILYDYRHSCWAMFLAKWRQRTLTRDTSATQQTEKLASQRLESKFAEVASLLIKHGADTLGPTCVTHHAAPLYQKVIVPKIKRQDEKPDDQEVRSGRVYLEPEITESCERHDFRQIVQVCTLSSQCGDELLRASCRFSTKYMRDVVHKKQHLILPFQNLRKWAANPRSLFVLHPISMEAFLEEVGDRNARFREQMGMDVVDHAMRSWGYLPGVDYKSNVCSWCPDFLYICLECATFPKGCKACSWSWYQVHERHLIMDVSLLRNSLHLAKEINRWFEAHAESYGIEDVKFALLYQDLEPA